MKNRAAIIRHAEDSHPVSRFQPRHSPSRRRTQTTLFTGSPRKLKWDGCRAITANRDRDYVRRHG